MTRELHRSMLLRPTTADENSRSVELTIASSADVGDGVSLICRADAVEHAAVVPILLDHKNSIDRMAGRLESLRFAAGQLLGRAVFTDAPAADEGWALARSGCAVSVGASLLEVAPSSGGGPDLATRWRLGHVALVPQGADSRCVTRSASLHETNSTNTMENSNGNGSTAVVISEEAPALERSASAVRLERDILRACVEAGLDADATDTIVRSSSDYKEATRQIFTKMRLGLSQSPAGHPASIAPRSNAPRLEDVLAARLGCPSADPMVEIARFLPLSRSVEHLVRGADHLPPSRILERAWSTSDFKLSLESAGARTVEIGYADAQLGIRAIAALRPLEDFRATTQIRYSKMGSLQQKMQGGSYVYGNMNEEQASVLRATEHGSIVKLTRQSLVNDDLNMAGELLKALGEAAARLEADLLTAALLGSGITWNPGNSATGLADLAAAMVAGTLRLRRQTDSNNRPVSFVPRLLLVSPELEADALRLLSDRYTPTSPSGVSPFNVQLEVEAGLVDPKVAYLVDTNYKPLLLGTIGSPTVTNFEEFESGSMSFKVVHDCGAVTNDSRSIVRLTLA